MLEMNGAWRTRLAALVAVSVLMHVACGDDDSAPTGAGGADDSQAGAVGSGGDGAAGEDGATAGGNAPAQGGGPSAGQAGQTAHGEGGAAHGEGGTASVGDAGAGGQPTEPCTGEVLDGECFPLFELVQSKVTATGSAASSSSVALAESISSGSTVLLGVGIIWNGVAKTITVPANFTLVERRDNAVGVSGHESAALYIAESAAALPALSPATVSVDDAQSRLFLALAEYSGLRVSDVVDQKTSQAGSSAASPGTTAQTAFNQELWVVLTMSRGGVDHTAPTENFAFVDATKTGAGSFSLMQKLVSQRGQATTSLTSIGDYASVLVTLRR